MKLSRASERKLKGLFVIEGEREILKALESGYRIEQLYYCPEISVRDSSILFPGLEAEEKFSISKQVFEKIAYRDNTDGLIAVSSTKHRGLDSFPVKENCLILVLETVEKPGNLGAVLRTADAAGVDAVVVCDNQTDIYNPNVIRSSLGCVFTNLVLEAGSEETIKELQKRKVSIFSAALQDSVNCYDSDFTGPTAIVMGSEAHGLSMQWRKAADAVIRIPMFGVADSMNVSVSAAILLYEAVRQRKYKTVNQIC